jgi:hypothetical protein
VAGAFLAKDIYQQILQLRHRAQDSLKDGSNVLDFEKKKSKKKGDNNL